jgi:ATP synthase protein I
MAKKPQAGDSPPRDDSHRPSDVRQPMLQEVGSKEIRKLRARREQHHSIWFGLGTFGVVGWSVAVPTLLGVALGIWIDSRWPGSYSWTLMLLFGGLILGCLNAWYWISQEREGISVPEKDGDDG